MTSDEIKAEMVRLARERVAMMSAALDHKRAAMVAAEAALERAEKDLERLERES